MTMKLFLLFFAVGFAKSADLPEYLKSRRCAVDDKDLIECFIKNGNEAIPIVANGDPDYNLPKMNPLEIPFINLISMPTLSLNITNVKLYGLDNLKIQDVQISTLEEIYYTNTMKGDNLTLIGNYEIKGRILVMPIEGEGPFSIYLKDGIYKISGTISYYEKDGDQYFKPAKVHLDYHLNRIVFNFENLFQGDKILGDQMNNFLNESWDLLAVDFGDGITKIIADYITKIFEAFCSRVPAKNFWA